MTCTNLDTLPNEILQEIFLLAKNLALTQVSQSIRYRIDNEHTRILFCTNAIIDAKLTQKFSRRTSHEGKEISRIWNLCDAIIAQVWFDYEFSSKVLACIEDREILKDISKGLASMEDRKSMRDDNDFTNNRPPYRMYLVKSVLCNATMNAKIPSRFLRGPWTDADARLFYRLVVWGAEISKARFRSHLRKAIRENRPELVDILLNLAVSRYSRELITHRIFIEALENGCSQAIAKIIVAGDGQPWGKNIICWGGDKLRRVLEARFTTEKEIEEWGWLLDELGISYDSDSLTG